MELAPVNLSKQPLINRNPEVAGNTERQDALVSWDL